jgi:hypothetical protein
MQIDIVLDENQLNRLGTGSLVGIAVGKTEECNLSGAHVRLLFPQTSLSWRKAHNGPDSLVVVEYAPMCLAEGVIDLIRAGATVEIVQVDLK